MALQECGLNLNSVSKELQPHGSLAFPCAGYASRHTDRPEDSIPWHWHEEIEIIYIENGQIEVKIPSQSFLLKKGDCLVINANIVHYATAVPEGSLHSLVFSPALISGKEDSVFSKKYISPLIACPAFSGYYISADSGEEVACLFRRAFEALAGDHYGFEFTVRENLSRICLFLYQKFSPQMDLPEAAPNQDNLRLSRLLTYIHKHFAEPISVSDIAREAGISERECLRCFQKTIQLSPIQYLLKYRVMQGAELLLTNPSASISEIGTLCGFDSQSHFAKMFKRFYNCTPREYRNRNLKSLTAP